MKKKIGRMPCETCGNDIVVKINEKETLSYRCDECEAAPYARLGTPQHELWHKKMGSSVEKAPAAEKPPVKKQESGAGAGFFG